MDAVERKRSKRGRRAETGVLAVGTMVLSVRVGRLLEWCRAGRRSGGGGVR
jgi:hypothetical protein